MKLRTMSMTCGSLRTSAFGLVEVVLAVGIVAFGIVVIFAMLPTGLASVQDGKMEEAGSDILVLVAKDLDAAPRVGLSPLFELDPSASGAATKLFNISGVKVETRDEAAFQLVASPQVSDDPDLCIWHLAVEWPVPPESAGSPPRDSPNRVESVTFLRR